LGTLNVITVFSLAGSVMTFGWLGAMTWRSFVVFLSLYGFFSGALVSLPAACVASLTDPADLSKMGVRIGMMFTSVPSF
jgi:hypothetical protein